MGGRVLALDTVLSATFCFVRRWSPDLARNQSRDLLRFLLCRLYDEGKGKLIGSQVTLAQSTLAHKMGLSRQWVGILLARLQAAGWVEYSAPVLDDGMHGSTVMRIGRQVKRLLIMLGKSRRPKTQVKSDDKPRWHFSPSVEEKRLLLIQKKEHQPLQSALLSKIPLLQTWLHRGESSPINRRELEGKLPPAV
jgi:hypothetical protein